MHEHACLFMLLRVYAHGHKRQLRGLCKNLKKHVQVKNNIIMGVIALFTLTLASCKKDKNDPEPNATGNMVLEFDNVVGAANLQLGTNQIYTNASGEKFSVSTFNYFISNIVLKRADGLEVVYPVHDSTYFLVKENTPASQEIELFNIPVGQYSELSFTIGVDSAKSAQTHTSFTGILNPANHADHGGDGMYWTWASGYIFLKFEGTAEKAVTAENPEGKFYYHIGGFGGPTPTPINNVRRVTLPFPSGGALVTKTKTPQAHLMVDVLKVFDGSTQVKIEERPVVMLNPFSTNVSANYAKMFMIHHVH